MNANPEELAALEGPPKAAAPSPPARGPLVADEVLGLQPQPLRSLSSALLGCGVAGVPQFATADERADACVRLEAAGRVVAIVENVDSSARGRLGEIIDDAVEEALLERGAGEPSVAFSRDRNVVLNDQLSRARRTGATGIAIVLGPVRGAGRRAVLVPEDCATLRFYVAASAARPVELWLDQSDAQTSGYGDPVCLRDLLSPSMDKGPAVEAPTPAACVHAAPAPAVSGLQDGPATPLGAALADRGIADSDVVLRSRDADHAWRAWTLQLCAARGPQALTSLERLFAESYMPLSNAIAAGLDDPRAKQAHDEFRATFARGYSEAFAMFAATTKRPRMVLDAPDLAARLGRLHGARSTRLLLVDAMRWDISRMIESKLLEKLGSRAALAEELVLWSSLPTTTMRQLETIARGVEALRAPSPLEAEPEVPRGRTADYVRRMRVGPRELSKLDLIEARIAATVPARNARHEMPELATEAADALARHIETLAPRTLVFVFGDHGFALDKAGVARQGGSSPEEVLVGAFALLIGDVH